MSARRAASVKRRLRRYLVTKGRAVRASGSAFTLIDAIPQAIADPGMTAVWEQALESIEKGQLTMEAFIAKQSAWITQLIQQYAGASLAIQAPETPKCPLCGSTTRKRSGKNGEFYSCTQYPICSGTLPVSGGKSSKRKTKRSTAKQNE